MEGPRTRAERLPDLYRAILDAVSELERDGRRGPAMRARRRATRAYATWNERAERRLEAILEDARRDIAPDAGRPGLRARLRLRGRAASRSLVRPTA
jgi:hypothetical protein